MVNKEKKETEEHYRSILRLIKEQMQYESEWNETSSKAENFDFVAELEKLTA
ncbi:hypothetical protein YC2023_043922 [Brassica napus]